MPLSRSRDYLSIGEVLEGIRGDFPDVSISKIRFLEAEGLIAPRRTGSGYRMFYETDVARLRYILALQRDHFLPLKVIRERLAQADSNGGVYPEAATAAPAASSVAQSASSGSESVTAAPVELAGVQMDRGELMSAAGLDEAQMSELEEYGMLVAGESGVFNENDLMVAKASSRFFDYGVQARHLKMYRQFADREVAFFEQIVTPTARRRDPGGQTEAARSLQELAGLSRQIKEASLRAGLRDLL